MSSDVSFQSIIDVHANLGRVVLVTGNFNVLHPGHIRLLRFAKECGDTLVVGVNCDESLSNKMTDEVSRKEVVSSLEFVDFCFVNTLPVEQLIERLKPWAVVKGKEYEKLVNSEKRALDEYGGKLVFSSGNSRASSQSYLAGRHSKSIVDIGKVNGYLERYSIRLDAIRHILEQFKQKRVLVIGDTIVDQYVQCNAVGMSQEDPTIVVTPDESKLFLGGAGIVAGHAKSLGAQSVQFYSVLGNDKQADFAETCLTNYGVDCHLFNDDTRPTNLKTRYRVGAKTLLRVNEVRSHDISEELQAKILRSITSVISDVDVLLFSDFNYGMLPQALVDQITQLAKMHSVTLAADSQTSSQVGDIARFKHMDMLTPTEREVRVALKNDKDGLVILGQKLAEVTGCNNLFITLAEEGVFIHKIKESLWVNDRIKALSDGVVDPAGAGDCLFISAALAISTNASTWEAAFIGSVAAACQVGNVGNKPINLKILHRAIESFWHHSEPVNS